MDYENVIKDLLDYAKRAVAKGAKAVILIGSLARKDYTAFSDADLVIISDNVPENPVERISEFIDPSLPIDLDLRVFKTEEFLRMAKERKRIVEELVGYGKLLAGDAEIIEIAKRFLAER